MKAELQNKNMNKIQQLRNNVIMLGQKRAVVFKYLLKQHFH